VKGEKHWGLRETKVCPSERRNFTIISVRLHSGGKKKVQKGIAFGKKGEKKQKRKKGRNSYSDETEAFPFSEKLSEAWALPIYDEGNKKGILGEEGSNAPKRAKCVGAVHPSNPKCRCKRIG